MVERSEKWLISFSVRNKVKVWWHYFWSLGAIKLVEFDDFNRYRVNLERINQIILMNSALLIKALLDFYFQMLKPNSRR